MKQSGISPLKELENLLELAYDAIRFANKHPSQKRLSDDPIWNRHPAVKEAVPQVKKPKLGLVREKP